MRKIWICLRYNIIDRHGSSEWQRRNVGYSGRRRTTSNVDVSKYYFRIIVVIVLLRVILREITTIISLSGRFRSLHTLRTVGVTRYVLRLTPKIFEMNHSKFFLETMSTIPDDDDDKIIKRVALQYAGHHLTRGATVRVRVEEIQI